MGPGPQQWEYKILSAYASDTLQRELNELGKDGWELVNGQRHAHENGQTIDTFYLKRPLN